MAGDVIYADLTLAEGRGPPSSNAHNSPPCPPWHGLALKAGCAGLLLLLVTVAGLGVWAFQGSPSKEAEGSAQTGDGVTPSTSSGRAHNANLEDLVSRLKQSVCDPAQINSTGGAGCKLCPRDWWLHGDKCYWLSKEPKSWNESREDCARRGSQLLVIRDQEHMGNLHPALSGADSVWIGSLFNSSQKKWTWLDGAPVDKKLFPRQGEAPENNCGVLQGSKVGFDTCTRKLKCLCQKDAFPL
ncbi:killer cell lectin-like receptor subfamily B member 1B allele B [Pelodiscus sinensis]|uniref:killer cell lectin-like receptor subfamily B member 1B allele B n=1 Tax=Pelodiscus sinensis TaxID=13735 RepID=UPI003F6C92CF